MRELIATTSPRALVEADRALHQLLELLDLVAAARAAALGVAQRDRDAEPAHRAGLLAGHRNLAAEREAAIVIFGATACRGCRSRAGLGAAPGCGRGRIGRGADLRARRRLVGERAGDAARGRRAAGAAIGRNLAFLAAQRALILGKPSRVDWTSEKSISAWTSVVKLSAPTIGVRMR